MQDSPNLPYQMPLVAFKKEMGPSEEFKRKEVPDALLEVLEPFLAPYKAGWASFAD